MAGIAGGGAPSGRPARAPLRRRAAGIYGTIITAAVLAATGDHAATLPLAISVLVTLLVYSVAEEYAELLGEQLESRAGARLGRYPRGRQQLAITSIAAALGLLMIILKDVILIHLH